MLKRFIAIFFAIAVFLAASTSWGRIDDPIYHRAARVAQELFALQDSFPDWVHVDSIGYAQTTHRPIYCARITENVMDPPGSKPGVIITGQVHAEEVLGVELCLWFAHKMVANTRQSKNWRRYVDLYIVPTANPDGLDAVYDYDNSWRKNTRDMIGDGIFRFLPGWGGDTSGVDLNRNFAFGWRTGDPFLTGGANELYDYFRGPGPASESETQALIRLMDRVRPLYQATYHSSRTGNVAEQVIYPYAFDEANPDLPMKPPPDFPALKDMALQVANRCNKFGLKKPYKTVSITSPNGSSDLDYYWRFGTFGYRIEIGAAGDGMQPDSAGVYQVISDVRMGLEYLLNSAAATDATDENGVAITRSRFVIYVTDDAGNPLEARVALKNWISPTFPYRLTNAATGRYFWQVLKSYSDTLIVSKFGYQQVRRAVSAGDTPAKIGGSRGIQLTTLPKYNVTVKIYSDTGIPITQPVELNVSHPDSVWDYTVYNGKYEKQLPQGTYTLTFYTGTTYVPRRVTVDLNSDTTWNVRLCPARTLLNQNFDGADISFTTDNDINKQGNAGDSLSRWEVTNDISHSGGRCITDSRLSNVLRNEDGWCAPYDVIERSFDLSRDSTAALTYWLNQDLEPGYDTMFVEVWTPDSGWVQVEPCHQSYADIENVPLREWNAPPINLMQYNNWQRFIVPLDAWCGKEGTLHFRFHLRSDDRNTTDGVYIDDIELTASSVAPPHVSSIPVVPEKFDVTSAFPNPFNGVLNVAVTLPQADRLQVRLYDVQGRMVLERPLGALPAGLHQFSVDAGMLPTAMYFLTVTNSTDRIVRKVMLLK